MGLGDIYEKPILYEGWLESVVAVVVIVHGDNEDVHDSEAGFQDDRIN